MITDQDFLKAAIMHNIFKNLRKLLTHKQKIGKKCYDFIYIYFFLNNFFKFFIRMFYVILMQVPAHKKIIQGILIAQKNLFLGSLNSE